MKILIRHEHNASHYIYTGIGREFLLSGNECLFWDEKIPAFDIFNTFEPDMFIGQGYNLDRATIKCIKNRPNLKVLLKVGCFGEVCQDVDTEKYPILMHTEEELKNVGAVAGALSAVKNLVLFNYVHPNRQRYLMGGWEETVAKTIGLLPAADMTECGSSIFDPSLKCEIGFTGGYWPYKGQNLDKYIIPLCYPVGKYNIKIFGNQPWPVPQYMGVARDETVKNLFKSALICPNVSEPHANVFGFEVNERIFKLAASGAFFISDPIASLTEDIFTKGEAVVAENPDDFHDLIKDIIKNPSLRDRHIEACKDTVLKNHTYKHRVEQIMESFENE